MRVVKRRPRALPINPYPIAPTVNLGRMARLDRLSPDDAAILRLESAAITGHTCKVLILEPGPSGPPSLEELRRHVEGRLWRVPRARRRLARTPFRVAPPVWIDDADFEIAAQVTACPLASGEPLRGLVAELMSQRLEHSRPLWHMNLVGPLDDGTTVIVWRIHHAMADGMTCLRLGAAMLWDRESAPIEDPGPPWLPERPPTSRHLLAQALGERARALSSAMRDAGRAAIHPRRLVGEAGRLSELPGALRRQLRPIGSASPLAGHISAAREVAFVGRPLEDLIAAEQQDRRRLGLHVTINDLLLAAVAGGIRHWLEDERLALEPMRVKVPVSLHRPDEGGDVANRDSFLFLDLPCDEPDSGRRLERITAEAETAKEDQDAAALYHFFHGLSHLGPLGRAGVRLASSPHEFSLAVSNVPGPRDTLYVMGRPVRELYSIAEPADRHALRVSALSCAGTLQVGLCTDPTHLHGLDRLAAGLDRSFDELLG
jgi:WS/DGAT/MGAT family acyltransferase